MPDNAELIEGVRRGDTRAVARLITLSENRVPRAREIQATLFKEAGSAHVVGVTGSPGAGKSTLVDQLAQEWKRRGKRVAILAIDPTSPFSGGAVLGDRIRMSKASENSDIFIRSMATRGSLGGISRGTLDAIQILDSAGFDLILVETVGVGQAEVDIVRTADCCLVVLVPGMGDSVQSMKAGILEIADVFVLNKADREGVDLLQKDLRILLSLANYEEGQWIPEILQTIAVQGEGVPELADKMFEHKEWLTNSDEGRIRRTNILRKRIISLASELLYERFVREKGGRLEQVVEECLERKKDPYTVVEELLKTS